jgi:hypothetical protein
VYQHGTSTRVLAVLEYEYTYVYQWYPGSTSTTVVHERIVCNNRKVELVPARSLLARPLLLLSVSSSTSTTTSSSWASTMSAEPLEVMQPGMEEGTFVSAAPATTTANASYRSVLPEDTAAAPAVAGIAGAAGVARTPSVKAVVMHDEESPAARKQQPPLVAEDPEYDPNVVGDFDYPAMPPQECCGGHPPLAPCCYKRRMGRAYVCCERRGAEPKILFMCGAGWTTQVVTIVLLFGISGGAYGYGLRLLHWAFLIGTFVVAVLGCLAVSAVGCCDPGIFPRYLKKKEKDWRYCQQSASFRPAGIQWCDETGVRCSTPQCSAVPCSAVGSKWVPRGNASSNGALWMCTCVCVVLLCAGFRSPWAR